MFLFAVGISLESYRLKLQVTVTFENVDLQCQVLNIIHSCNTLLCFGRLFAIVHNCKVFLSNWTKTFRLKRMYTVCLEPFKAYGAFSQTKINLVKQPIDSSLYFSFFLLLFGLT